MIMNEFRPLNFDENNLNEIFKNSLLATRGYVEKTIFNFTEIQKYYISYILHLLCKYNTDQPIKKLFKISYNINKSCHRKVLTYEDHINYDSIYQIIIFKIIMNLDPESSINNMYLMNNIINNNIDVKEICFCDSNILCPSKNYDIYKKVKERNNIIAEKKFTTLYTCGKCKQKKCTVQSVQLRSADEGCNLRIDCTNCGYCWIM
jgi:transcription elongation factor S-II